MIALAEAGVKAIFPGDRVRASLKPLVLSAPHLVARLSELLLRFTEFALKALQLAFEATNFPLDSFDPVNLSVLRISHCRHMAAQTAIAAQQPCLWLRDLSLMLRLFLLKRNTPAIYQPVRASGICKE